MAKDIPNRQAYMHYYSDQSTKPHFSINKYVESEHYDHRLFIDCLAKEIYHRLGKAKNVNIVVLEGYVLKHYERIFQDLKLPPERTLVLHATIDDNRYKIDEFDVTGYRYEQVTRYIRQVFQSKCLGTTLPRSFYQSFASLGLHHANGSSTASDTTAKYAASHLDDIVQSTDRFIDTGCNAGYFCFRLAGKTGGRVAGIDINRHWVEIASHLNNSIFLRRNISFFKSDAFEFLNKNPDSFEIIHCASTYHYFRDRQTQFLQAAHRALSAKGTLVLEVELADTGPEPELVRRSRSANEIPCAFPNRVMFHEQLGELFTINAEYESVFQKGSCYNRVYFHLHPK